MNEGKMKIENNKFEFKKKRSLDEIMTKTGYKEVGTVEDLELSEKEKNQAKDFIKDEIHKRFFIAERSDGKQAKAIIFEGEKIFDGHIFSPFGYEGYMECNDWSDNELTKSLLAAKERGEEVNSIINKEK
jgi:sporulation protein YlmC with PRC-barrel domain